MANGVMVDGIRYIGYHWASGYELSDIDEASPLLNFVFYSIEVFPQPIALCQVPAFYPPVPCPQAPGSNIHCEHVGAPSQVPSHPQAYRYECF
ncbi:hypothetical protein CY34DRAFT_177368 [Suillus luteus UH-Slu-Lm8-n1]|uniref:Unplaced genomic scaffold CY34scaffold_122, whole genome shotgun sequence n=1 Tax=Suillus luteus UH-Slu-Lm8-n1 TaxID=930992 RepID=A0A0D0BF55_9AGAM|nr:hypothetical protein CY34DRAFT_177368 [Suillus luteus UH-Slu-Lm8-n1]